MTNVDDEVVVYDRPQGETLRDLLNRQNRNEKDEFRWLFGHAKVEKGSNLSNDLSQTPHETSHRADAAVPQEESLREMVERNRRRLYGTVVMKQPLQPVGEPVLEDAISDFSSDDDHPAKIGQVEPMMRSQPTQTQAKHSKAFDALDGLMDRTAKIPKVAKPATAAPKLVVAQPVQLTPAPPGAVPPSIPPSIQPQPKSAHGSIQSLDALMDRVTPRRFSKGSSGTDTTPKRLSMAEAEKLLDGMAPSQPEGMGHGPRPKAGRGRNAPVAPQVQVVEDKLNREYEKWSDHTGAKLGILVRVESIQQSSTMATLRCTVLEDTTPSLEPFVEYRKTALPAFTPGVFVDVMMPLALRRDTGVVAQHHLLIGSPFYTLPAAPPIAATIMCSYCVKAIDPDADNLPQFRYPSLDHGSPSKGAAAVKEAPREGIEVYEEGPGDEWHVSLDVLRIVGQEWNQ